MEAGASVCIAGKRTDASHALAWKGGVWFCTACGGFAKASIGEKSTCRDLARPCKGQANKHGMTVLGRIAGGLTPRIGMRWPMDPGVPSSAVQQTVEELWPDRRLNTRRVRRRIVGKRTVTGEAGIIVSDLQNEVSELNEDEDPWGS